MKLEAIERIRNYIKNQKWHNYLVILPTPDLVERFIDELLDEEVRGVFYPKIYTFDQFVGEVLGRGHQYIGDIGKKEIIRDIVIKLSKAGKLQFIQENSRYGIIQFIAEAISELKQFAIDAERFSEAAQSLANPRVADLAEIYCHYEALLKARGLKDNEDRFLDVLTRLENKELPILKDVEYLYADWFVDNTLVQHKIFEALIKIIPHTDVTLGIYGTTNLKDITRLYPAEEKYHLANVIYSATAGQKVSLPKVGCFKEINKEDEVKKILHEVIRLLGNNISVNDIAIVARNPQEYADLFVKCFDKINVPLEIEIKKTLISSPLIKSIMLWFELAKDYSQTPFALEVLLDDSYLTDGFAKQREVIKWANLQGKHTLPEWIELWEKDKENLVRDWGQETYDQVLQVLESILHLWSLLPQEGQLKDIIAAIKNNLENLNIEARIGSFADNLSLKERIVLNYRDNQALDSFKGVINNLEAVWAVTNRHGTLSGVLEDIKDYVNTIYYSCSRNYGSGIKVLSPTEIRGLKFHSVMVLGMEQNEFPKLVLQNPLLKDNERIHLRKYFYLPLSNEIYEREKLLFYLVIRACKKELFFTYAAANEEGQPNLASLFVEDVLSLISEDAELKAYDPLMVEESPSSHLTHLLNVEAHRNSPAFTIYEGCFESEFMVDMVKAKTYAKSFSISILNNYARCPMKYFLINELGLTDEIDTRDGISKPELGSIKHEVLARVLSKYEDLDVTNLVNTVEEVLKDICQEKGYKGEEYPHQWLWELEKSNIVESLSNLIAGELHRGTLKPYLFEWRFGTEDKPFYLEVDGKKISIRGIIDRIDKDEEGHYAVYDYKDRVSVSRKDVEGARELQLPVYIMAVEEILGEVIGTSYLEIKEGKPKQLFYKNHHKERLGFDNSRSGGYEPDEWENWLKDIKLQAENYIKGIARGFFPTIPHSCRYCHLKDICLYKPSRVRLKEMGGA